VLFVHGGGWVAGSTVAYRRLAHRLAEAGFLTFNLDYRLAPEHPFPAAFVDCVAALQRLEPLAARHGGDLRRLAVVGDSAGANLAAAAAIAQQHLGRQPAIRAAVLFYGIYDLDQWQALFADDARDRLITREVMGMMVEGYLGTQFASAEPPRRDPRLSPLFAVEHLPPTLLIVGSADPFRPQSEAMATAMQHAGRVCELQVLAGMRHGFVQTDFLPVSRLALETAAAFLRRWSSVV
jgi:acetyl esterase